MTDAESGAPVILAAPATKAFISNQGGAAPAQAQPTLSGADAAGSDPSGANTPTPDAVSGAALATDAAKSAPGGFLTASQGLFALPAHADRPGNVMAVQAAVTTPGANIAASPNEQVAVHIAQAVHKGNDRLVVQLHPQSLGRIRVELEVGPDNRVIAVIGAERQETLDLMQRDTRGLERALNDAGLKADSGSLSFNLHSGGDHRSAAGFDGGGRPMPVSGFQESPPPMPQPYRAYGRVAADGVDIRV